MAIITNVTGGNNPALPTSFGLQDKDARLGFARVVARYYEARTPLRATLIIPEARANVTRKKVMTMFGGYE